VAPRDKQEIYPFRASLDVHDEISQGRQPYLQKKLYAALECGVRSKLLT
jgi:hypothetical protein